MASSVQEKLSLFCQNSSLRGVPKIVRSKSRFLKVLWFLFVMLMVVALFSSAWRIILEFLSSELCQAFDDVKEKFQSIEELSQVNSSNILLMKHELKGLKFSQGKLP